MPGSTAGADQIDEPITQEETRRESQGSNEPVRPRIAPRWVHILGLALPLASVALVILATWLPWVTIRALFSLWPDAALLNPSAIVLPYNGANGFLGLLARLSPSAPLQFRYVSLISSAWPLCGLLLALFFLRQHQQRVSRTLLVLYGGWLALTSIVTMVVIFGLFTVVAPLSCSQTCSPMPVTSRQPSAGLLVVLIGLGLGWLALVLLVRGRATPFAAAPAMAAGRSSPLRWVGVGVFSLGVALWMLAVLAIPWATSGCTGLHLSLNHFVQGTCSGVDGWDVFTTGLGRYEWLGLLALEIIPTMGLFVVITVWLPRLTRSTWVTALSWVLLLTVLFFVAVAGVRATIAHPPVLTTLAHDPWVADRGAVICALGILLGWIGVGLLARDEIAQACRRAALWR